MSEIHLVHCENLEAPRKKWCNKVKNSTPHFTVPKQHTSRLAFIGELVSKCDKVNVVKSDVALYMRQTMARSKAFYPDRERAIRALTKVFCEHVNVVTHQVSITLVQAAKLTGLDTVSDAERLKAKSNPDYEPKVNISRASRAVQSMIELGWIVAPKEWQKWNKEAGQWLDKYFEVTDLFFSALGITQERVIRQREARLKYLKKKGFAFGVSAEELGRMTLSEIKTRARMAHYQRALERMRSKRVTSRVKRSMKDKTNEQHRELAQKSVLYKLGSDFAAVTLPLFKDMVNIELAMLRKIAGIPKPT